MPLVYNQGSFILQFLHQMLSSILCVDKTGNYWCQPTLSQCVNVKNIFLNEPARCQHNNKKCWTQNNIILSVVNTKCRYAKCWYTEYTCYTVFTMANDIKKWLMTSTGSCHIIYLPWYLGHRDIYQKLLHHARSRGKKSLRFSVKNAASVASAN